MWPRVFCDEREKPQDSVGTTEPARQASANALERARDALLTLMRARLREGLSHDETVEAPHPDMRTALAIAASDSYPTARPVDERCLALVRCKAVWSEKNHASFPRDERIAASSRALLMGV